MKKLERREQNERRDKPQREAKQPSRRRPRPGSFFTDIVGAHDIERNLKNVDIDKQLKDIFVEFASQDFVLSNLNDDDIHQIMLDFDEAVNQYITEIPEWEFDWYEDRFITQFRAWLRARLMRGRQGFERKMQKSQTRIQRSIQEAPGLKGSGSGGPLEKLGKLLGKGNKSERERRGEVPPGPEEGRK